jgi:hypothetical protein
MLGMLSIASANNSSIRYDDVRSSEANGCLGADCVKNTQNIVFNDDITLIEPEEEIDLGFDPYLYLPEDFNPYEGMVLDINDIVVYDIEEEVELGFDTAPFLPKDFNPYKGL